MRPAPMPLRLLAASLAAATLAAATPSAAEDSPFSAAEEEAIGRVVRDYILEHPEIILEAVQELERRKQAESRQQRDEAIAANSEQLFSDPASPVVGDPEGDVTVVEFFDYNCGYCRRMTEDIFELVEDDGDIRFVLKELPIFGEGSRFAAKAALAADRQGLYGEFHYALMTAGVTIDQASTMAIAAEVGLDLAQLEEDMLDPAIDAQLDANYRLARALGVEGTPATVIGETFLPGARGYDELAALVAKARAAQ